MDQQLLIERIVSLAMSISLNAQATKYVTVSFDGPANQLAITLISRRNHRQDTRSIGLHEPGEPEISRERVLRMLREELTNLQSLHCRSTIHTQRRLLP